MFTYRLTRVLLAVCSEPHIMIGCQAVAQAECVARGRSVQDGVILIGMGMEDALRAKRDEDMKDPGRTAEDVSRGITSRVVEPVASLASSAAQVRGWWCAV